ncbi:MAG: hypothetical protein JSS83_22220 [Cyanobacteria bacterium SZAS LIN-3]|nr:hypothetical protein [Cyanobacteria bacterium SZAS LIN-3]MBS2005752.1 hypothetical protein [Cyanobacteria bacterium SZAS TMP-1]
MSIDEGTVVRLKLGEAISSKHSAAGQKIFLTVLEDVLARDGKTVCIKEGVSAIGYLTNVDEKDGAKGGKLCLEISSVKAVDDTRVPLRGMKTKSGKNGAGVGSYVLGGVLFGLVGLGVVALFSGGSHVKIPAGTVVSAFTDRDVTVSVAPASEAQPMSATTDVSSKVSLGAESASAGVSTASPAGAGTSTPTKAVPTVSASVEAQSAASAPEKNHD